MSANVEWDIPFQIESSHGVLDLNAETTSFDGLFLLLESGCTATRSLRVVSDEIPQGDGQIHHRRFTDGYEVRLLIGLWESRTAIACDETLRDLTELLMLHLNDMLNTPGRVLWAPTGLGDDRMLDQARTFEVGPPGRGEQGQVVLPVGFDSPFPYVIDATEHQVTIVDGVAQNVTNSGTVESFPVWKIDGPTNYFEITNNDTGETLVYDASNPGASAIASGHYIEFDFFRNTAYLDGSGANRKAGIVLSLSDFWTIEPGGAVSVQVDGADGTLLYSNALA